LKSEDKDKELVIDDKDKDLQISPRGYSMTTTLDQTNLIKIHKLQRYTTVTRLAPFRDVSTSRDPRDISRSVFDGLSLGLE